MKAKLHPINPQKAVVQGNELMGVRLGYERLGLYAIFFAIL
jgi:hypothetical protein